MEKSAEVIVVVVTSYQQRDGGLTSNEGLNMKLFQMLHGGKSSHALSGTGKQNVKR
jgi:hypothetical protein